MAIALLGALSLYVIVVVIAVLVAIRIARKRGLSPWKVGLATALGFYLIGFWDHLPTLVLLRLKCAQEAGVMLATRDSDVGSSPEIASRLMPKQYDMVYDLGDGTRAYWLNEHFYHTTQSAAVSTVLPVTRVRKQIVDSVGGRAIATSTAFDAGYASWPNASGWERLKIWVGGGPCVPDEREYLGLRDSLSRQRQK